MSRRHLARLARAALAARPGPPLPCIADAAACEWAGTAASAALRSPPRARPHAPPARGFAAAPVQGEEEKQTSMADGDANGDGGGDGSSTDAVPPPPQPPLPRWLTTLLPPSLLPYAELARLDKLVGTALLLWPCWWSIAAAAPQSTLPNPSLLALFAVGAVLLRGAGCTINDWWDRDLDRRVERTAGRPLARGAVSPTGAAVFAVAQLAAGLAVLLQLNGPSISLGAASLPLVGGYPLAKRVTDWPQFVLGLTFNWGALLGWTAVTGTLDPTATPLLLYASGILWTLAYDTIYAFQDAAHDRRVGVRSSALALAARGAEKSGVAAFFATSLALLAAAGSTAGLGPAFWCGWAGAAGHAGWQVAAWRVDSPADCGAKFKSNATYGGLVFAAIVAGKLCG